MGSIPIQRPWSISTTGPSWVLKCTSFWHSNLSYFKKFCVLTTSVNAKYYLLYILFTIIKLSQRRCFSFCYQKLPCTGYRYPVKFFPDNISVFEIDEIGVKTLERELKSCLTGLTSRAFICRLPDLFQFYLNQWKHIHDLFKFQL